MLAFCLGSVNLLYGATEPWAGEGSEFDTPFGGKSVDAKKNYNYTKNWIQTFGCYQRRGQRDPFSREYHQVAFERREQSANQQDKHQSK